MRKGNSICTAFVDVSVLTTKIINSNERNNANDDYFPDTVKYLAFLCITQGNVVEILMRTN